MSLNDLQGWLVGEGLREDLDQLTRHTVVAELDNLVPPAEDEAICIRLATAFAWREAYSRGRISGPIRTRRSVSPLRRSRSPTVKPLRIRARFS